MDKANSEAPEKSDDSWDFASAMLAYADALKHYFLDMISKLPEWANRGPEAQAIVDELTEMNKELKKKFEEVSKKDANE